MKILFIINAYIFLGCLVPDLAFSIEKYNETSPKYNEAVLQSNFEKFINSLNYQQVTKDYPQAIKKLSSSEVLKKYLPINWAIGNIPLKICKNTLRQ